MSSTSIPSESHFTAPASTRRPSPCSSGRWPQAATSTVPSDLFGLVICHAKQGNGGRARAYFERAIAWVKANANITSRIRDEFKDFRSEAEAALKDSHQDLPDNVFAEVIPR